MKNKFGIMFVLLLFLVLISTFSLAETTTLDSTGNFSFSFIENSFVDENKGDISFYGVEDGTEEILIYANYFNGLIAVKEDLECQNISENDFNTNQVLKDNNEYCLITIDGNYVNLRILKISDDSKSLTFEWTILSEDVPSLDSGNNFSSNINMKQDFNFNLNFNWVLIKYLAIILINILIIVLIIMIFKKIMRVPKIVSSTISLEKTKVKKELKPKTQENILPRAYCPKCKGEIWIEDPEDVFMSDGNEAIKGHCPYCHTKIVKIIEHKMHRKIKKRKIKNRNKIHVKRRKQKRRVRNYEKIKQTMKNSVKKKIKNSAINKGKKLGKSFKNSQKVKKLKKTGHKIKILKTKKNNKKISTKNSKKKNSNHNNIKKIQTKKKKITKTISRKNKSIKKVNNKHLKKRVVKKRKK